VTGRNLSLTLSLYIGRQYFLIFLGILAIFISIVLMIDTIELMRRASGKSDVGFGVIMTMAVYKLPLTAQKTLPFAILFAGMIAFWQLNRHSELVALRAAGVSVWQFLLPVFAASLLIGIGKVTLINPLGTHLIAQYELQENQYLKRGSQLLAASSSGIWLRQSDKLGDTVIHAKRSIVDKKGLQLNQVMVLLYAKGDRYIGRLDAKNARLTKGYWVLTSVLVRLRDQPQKRQPSYKVVTELTLDKIQESFSSPSSISFWDLPSFIRALEATGFSALSHRLHWNSLLAEPMLYLAMILIAAVFSLRHNRRTGILLSVAGGVGAGFLLFFISDLVLALAHSTSVPPVMAAWSPAVASAFCGLAVLLHVEDG
jgi:lipopolysaccharide export system permease protein